MASPTEHAHLSASSSARWLTCTPSAKFGLEFPDSGETSDFAKEGTAAHAMAEIKLKYDTGKITKSTVGKYLRKFRRENEFWSMGFEEHVDDYVGYVNETIAEYEDPEVVLEQRVDFSEWVPEGFGTSDVVIMAEPILHIVDLKFGKGVPVSAIENTQLMLYALGTYAEFNLAYDFETIRMTIHQPRLHDVSTYEIPITELLDWAENYVKPRAKMAMAGVGEFNPSEKACRFCPAKAVCKARAEKNIDEFKEELGDDPRRLTAEDISSILERSGEVKKWIGDIEDYALTEARDNGKHFPRFKLVAGRSKRTIADQEAAAKILMDHGYNDVYKPKEMVAMTNLEKAIGKKKFNELLEDYIVKSDGKPALVAETDKRPEISSISSAIADFE